MDTATPAAIIERAHSLANEAIHMVALQRRRLRSEEPEDDTFLFRRWADFQFFIISLSRLRGAALLAIKLEPGGAVEKALQDFDDRLPEHFRTMRNVGEHIDEYAIERGRESQGRQTGASGWDLRRHNPRMAWGAT